MSGVYIPDMEKPKCCFLCPLSYAISPAKTGFCRLLFEENEAVEGGQMWRTISDVTKLADFCPLVAVPDHGRLIDADALTIELMDRGVDQIQLDDLSEIHQAIADAPTIIEAEESANIIQSYEDSKPRWISVTEQLPENKKETYWCYTDAGAMCECRWTNNRFGMGESDLWGWNIIDVPQYQKVTHWMPLPLPPKMKESFVKDKIVLDKNESEGEE